MNATSAIPSPIDIFLKNEIAVVVFIVLDVALGVLGGLLNGIAMLYYKSKMSESINHVLYFILTVLGIFISAGALLHSIILIFTKCYSQSILNIICPITFIMIIVSVYTSTMINICLAVVRTIIITQPLKVICKTTALVWIGVYGIAWLLVACTDVYYYATEPENGFGLSYYYGVINMSGAQGLVNLFHRHGLLVNIIVQNAAQIFPILIWGIPCVLPSVICLICFIVQIVSLWSRDRVGSDDIHRKVTVTILMLTLLFIFCNTVSFLYCMLMVYKQWDGQQYFLGLYIASSMVPFVNTLLNPVVLIIRGHELRCYVDHFLTRTSSDIRNSMRLMSRQNGGSGNKQHGNSGQSGHQQHGNKSHGLQPGHSNKVENHDDLKSDDACAV